MKCPVPRAVPSNIFRCGEQNGLHFRLTLFKEQITMFQTALIQERTGFPWGLITGMVAFAALLVSGYLLVT